jgi:Domain of unknown function (DUF1707)
VTTGPQDPVASRNRLRAAHADREQVIETLKTAFVDGRLTKSELAARTGQALAARTYADLAAVTADIPAEPIEPAALEPAAAVPAPAGPTADPPGLARPAAPEIRRPMVKAAAISGVCLGVAAAAVRIGAGFDPGGSGPDPHHSWAKALFLLALIAVFTALMTLGLGVITSIEQRRARRRLPPRTGPGGHGLEGERHDDASDDSVPPGSRADQTRTDMQARKSRQRGRRIPAREHRAPGGVSPAPGTA